MNNAVITIGRFQPLTLGHDKIIKKVEEISNNIKGVPIVFIVEGLLSSKDKSKNPLTGELRLKIMRHMYKNIRFELINNINEIEDILYILDYKLDTVITGSDRTDRYKNFFVGANIISIYRNEDLNDGVESISGTKIRKLILNDDFDEFYKVFPCKELAKEIFDIVKEINGTI